MSNIFNEGEKEFVLAEIPQGTRRVVFIDIPPRKYLMDTIETLFKQGIEVVVRDNHYVVNPEPGNASQIEMKRSAGMIKALIGNNANITTRMRSPSTSLLIRTGEFFGEGTVIVSAPDLDGLLASLKAIGVWYTELDRDAASLYFTRSKQTEARMSPMGYIFAKSIWTLPIFSSPQVMVDAQSKLFEEIAAAARGDKQAFQSLKNRVESYEASKR